MSTYVREKVLRIPFEKMGFNPDEYDDVGMELEEQFAGLFDYGKIGKFYGKLARDSDKRNKCQKIATMALQGSIECPENVFYQANFTQGDGIYETHETSYSTTWFCYDEEIEK